MSFEIKRLLSGSVTYGIGTVIQRFIGILLLPFFTSELTPADYGVISLISLVSTALTGIFNLGTANSMSILYFKEESPNGRSTIVWSAVVLLIFVSLFIVSALCIFSEQISSLIFEDKSYSDILIIAFIGLAITTITEPFLSFLRMEGRSRHFTIQSLSISFLTMVLSIFFILYMKWGALGFFLAGTLGQLIMLLVSLAFIAKELPFRVKYTIFSPLVMIGFPSIFGLFAFLIIDYGDRQILQRFLGLNELGLYSVGYNFGMVVMVVVNAFSSAWSPFFMSFINRKEETKVLFDQILRYYILGLGTLSLCFFGFAKPFLSFLVAPDYLPAYNVVGMVAVAYVLRGSYLLFLPGIYFFHKLKIQSLIEICVAIINILLNLWWIPLFGILGSALATMISYAFLPVLTHLAGKKLLNVAYEWGKISLGLGMMVVSSVLLFIFSQYFSNFKLIGISVFIIFTTFILSFRLILFSSERHFILNKLKLIKSSS